MSKRPNLDKLLAKWQAKLRLQDWQIEAHYAHQEDFQDKDAVGENCYSPTNKESVIIVLEPSENTSPFPRMHDIELTLVHELVHNIVSHKDVKANVEQVVEHLAKAFYYGGK